MRGGTRDDGGAELALEPLDGHRDVALALGPEQLLAGLGLALDADRRVLLDEAVEGRAHLVQVGLRLRLDGDRQ